jgi:hypothetical protein
MTARCAWCGGDNGELVWLTEFLVWLHNTPECAAGFFRRGG